MIISVVIVSWNTCDILKECLTSVYQQSNLLDIEVIVIDNASTDGSVKMIKREFPKVKLICNNRNRGFAAANNQGMEIAQGKYILLLNSDTIILKNAIDRVVTFAEEHHDAAVIGCRVLNPDRTLQNTCFMFPSILNLFLAATYLYKVFPKSKFFGRERMTWWNRDTVRKVDVVTGCFMLVRREAIENTGQMDERFFMYGEETDWCYRFKNANWRILFTPDAKIIHYGGKSSEQISDKMLIQLRKSILTFIKKHHSLLYYILSYFLVWLFFLLRIPFWFLNWLFIRGSRKVSRQHMISYAKAVFLMTFHGWRSDNVK